MLKFNLKNYLTDASWDWQLILLMSNPQWMLRINGSLTLTNERLSIICCNISEFNKNMANLPGEFDWKLKLKGPSYIELTFS